jgi:hypothetical protein
VLGSLSPAIGHDSCGGGMLRVDAETEAYERSAGEVQSSNLRWQGRALREIPRLELCAPCRDVSSQSNGRRSPAAHEQRDPLLLR